MQQTTRADDIFRCVLHALLWLMIQWSVFLNQNIYCGYLKEPSQRDGSFEHPKQMSKSDG